MPPRRLAPAVIAWTSVLFRLPPLLNAAGTNADAAVVGLQARHLLRGEWAVLLWGSSYQTAVDSTLVAGLFALFGATPTLLMLEPFAGHLLATMCVFYTLRRRIDGVRAFVLSLCLVFTSAPVHTYVLYPPRQASLTLALSAFALLDGAASRREPALHLALGAFVAGLAVFADPYAVVFYPPLVLLAALAALDGARAAAPLVRRGAAVAAGALSGLVPYALLQLHPRAGRGPAGWRFDLFAHNGRLLVETCLPWLLGARVYAARHVMDYAPVPLPPAVTTLGWIAGSAVLLGALAAVPLVFHRAIPWETRRLGFAAALVLPTTVGAFLGSVMAMDLFSARYLVAISLALPLALAPVAHALTPRALAILVVPYLAFTAADGWRGYAPFVKGVVPVVVSRGAEEEALRRALVDRSLHAAVADYWVAYRLAFLFGEDPIVVPLHPEEDRYPPYRRRFEGEGRFAYLFDPDRSREPLSEGLARVSALGAVVDRLEVGRVTVVVVDRRSDAARGP